MLRRAASLILAAALSLFTACEKQSNTNATTRMTDANRQNSAGGVVVIGLLAAMKLQECAKKKRVGPCIPSDLGEREKQTITR